METNTLNVLLISNNDGWTAVGLEQAVFAWGDSMEETIDRFCSTFWLEWAQGIKRGDPHLRAIPQAPQFYWDLAKSARKFAEPIEIEPPQLPEIKNLPSVMPETLPKLVGQIAA